MRLPPFGLYAEPGHAQERDGAGLGGDDRDEHHEPADVAAADEVGPQVLLRAGEPHPQEGHPEDVDGDDGEVERGELAWRADHGPERAAGGSRIE